MNTHTFSSTVRHVAMAVALASVTLVATGSAYAASNRAPHNATHGKFNIAEPAEVSGVVLEPGEYEVHVKNTPAGPRLEFIRSTYNPYAQEGLPVWDSEVVATVNANPQDATAKAAKTALLLSTEGHNKAVGLQIRGSSMDYVFPRSTQLTAESAGR